MMPRPVLIFALVAATLAAPPGASAQVRPPNIQAPLNAARAAAGKTNEQVKAAEKAGVEPKAAMQAATQGAMQGATQAKAGTAAGKAPATAPVTAAAGAPASANTGSVSQAGRRPIVTVMREAFTYTADGRRDPFVSLMLSGELRPIITDLVLTGVIFDESPGGRRSIALLTDNSTGEKYGVRIGQTLGRMRVARITRESVTFDIDEFGLSRSETLAIDKTAAPAARRP